MHENLTRDSTVKGPSDRNFGFVFTVVFLVIGGALKTEGILHALLRLVGADHGVHQGITHTAYSVRAVSTPTTSRATE